MEKEAGLGRQMAAEVRRQTRAIEDSGIQEYVNEVGRRLAAEIPEARSPFTFRVIAEDLCPPLHEPVGLPGGYIFVSAALFKEALREAEFAGMLAHSMEHVAQRDWSRGTTRAQTANFGSIPLIFLGASSGSCAENPAIPVGFLARQRENELEADALAVQAMARAGFDPTALLTYIGRDNLPGRKRPFSLLNGEERVAAMNPVVRRLPASNYEATSNRFLVVKEKAFKLAEGHDANVVPTLRRK